MRRTSIIPGGLGFLCLAWVTSMPLYYAFTHDHESIHDLSGFLCGGGSAAVPRWSATLLFQGIQFLAIPYGLWRTFRFFSLRIRMPVARGGVAGLIYGMWANTVFLTVPYLGGYPSIFGIGLSSLYRIEGEGQHLPLLAANVVVGMLFGVLLGLRKQSPLSLDVTTSTLL